jgi:superfamily I DNA and/or RNA helicase
MNQKQPKNKGKMVKIIFKIVEFIILLFLQGIQSIFFCYALMKFVENRFLSIQYFLISLILLLISRKVIIIGITD